MKRRQFLMGLGVIGLSSLSYAGFRIWPDAGIKNSCLTGLPSELSEHPLMKQIWADVDPTQVWDSHVHIVGTGDSDSDIWFGNPPEK